MIFEGFQVWNFRNIHDSGWIEASRITAFVGQNEAGKSNLFEALYCINPHEPGATYNIDEDWPVDLWEEKDNANGKLVCLAKFVLNKHEITHIGDFAAVQPDSEKEPTEDEDDEENAVASEAEQSEKLPEKATIKALRRYGGEPDFALEGFTDGILDAEKVAEWIKANVPKFVYIHDYEMSGAQVELNQLRDRLNQNGGNRFKLTNEDQTILIVLDLAKISLDDFLKKGETSEGRTVRSFDKRSASKYLSKQFSNLWTQKKVAFDIEIDGPTLNIFAEDENLGMPVRLHRRSTGFRWYVSFAWKFTHASNGDYKDCVLLLEEPGIHLHFSGQRDLLEVFDRLSKNNTILYTTHLSSMVDTKNPERVRIVEGKDHHLAITHGVVSSQRAPMAVIEQSLGLAGDQSSLLGNRQVLIVEGGDDALILHKLSGLLSASGESGLSNRIYLWPAHGAPKTPMYAAFSIGQYWDAGVLLDSDAEGEAAKKKIYENCLADLAEERASKFRTFMLGKAAGISKTDVAIEDLFPEQFYLDNVNSAYGLAIKLEDLSTDGSTLITKRVDEILKTKHGRSGLDKRLVMGELLKHFDAWNEAKDLPGDTAEKAKKLFLTINSAFEKAA